MRLRTTTVAIAATALLALPVAALAATSGGVAASGSVFLDLDGDGTRGAGEPGRADVAITLRTSATILDATMTGADGAWQFENVQPGTYTVAVDIPIDHVVTGGTTPGLDDADGTATITVGDVDLGDVGTIGLGSPVSSGPDVTITTTLDRSASSEDRYVWEVAVHDFGPGATDGPIDVRMVLSEGHATSEVSGAGWTCEESAAIVLCETATGIDAAGSLPVLRLTTTPSGEVGNTASVTSTVRLDGVFDAAPLNDEDSASLGVSADLAAVDLDGDGTGDLTDAGSPASSLLAVALSLVLLGGLAVRTTQRT